MTLARQALQQVQQLTNLIRTFILTRRAKALFLCYNKIILLKGSFLIMKIDYSQFEKNNWDEFVHVRALMDLLKKVAESDIGEDNIKSVDQTGITPDANGNPVYHVTYTDKDGKQQKKNIPLSNLTATAKSPYFAPEETTIKNMRFLADIPNNGKQPQSYDLTGELANGQTYHIPIYQTSIMGDMMPHASVKEPLTNVEITDNGLDGIQLNLDSALGHSNQFLLGGPVGVDSKNNSANLTNININTDNKSVALTLSNGSTITLNLGNDVTIDDPEPSSN